MFDSASYTAKLANRKLLAALVGVNPEFCKHVNRIGMSCVFPAYGVRPGGVP